jgi:hypothetical protein
MKSVLTIPGTLLLLFSLTGNGVLNVSQLHDCTAPGMAGHFHSDDRGTARFHDPFTNKNGSIAVFVGSDQTTEGISRNGRKGLIVTFISFPVLTVLKGGGGNVSSVRIIASENSRLISGYKFRRHHSVGNISDFAVCQSPAVGGRQSRCGSIFAGLWSGRC